MSKSPHISTLDQAVDEANEHYKDCPRFFIQGTRSLMDDKGRSSSLDSLVIKLAALLSFLMIENVKLKKEVEKLHKEVEKLHKAHLNVTDLLLKSH